MKLKHPKERYILLAFTIAVPILLTLAYFGFALWIIKDGGSKDYTNSTVNETHATFNVTSKGYYSTHQVTKVGDIGHFILKEDLDRMIIDHRYTCQIVGVDNKWYYPILGVNNYTLGNCTEL